MYTDGHFDSAHGIDNLEINDRSAYAELFVDELGDHLRAQQRVHLALASHHDGAARAEHGVGRGRVRAARHHGGEVGRRRAPVHGDRVGDEVERVAHHERGDCEQAQMMSDEQSSLCDAAAATRLLLTNIVHIGAVACARGEVVTLGLSRHG